LTNIVATTVRVALMAFLCQCAVKKQITNYRRNSYYNFVTLYDDDILLLFRSVCELQKLLIAYERELLWLDIIIITLRRLNAVCKLDLVIRCDL
jgi:hypothetical protein